MAPVATTVLLRRLARPGVMRSAVQPGSLRMYSESIPQAGYKTGKSRRFGFHWMTNALLLGAVAGGGFLTYQHWSDRSENRHNHASLHLRSPAASQLGLPPTSQEKH
ncbi:hypothetical protein DL93DRAFT_2096386 [Clavulina sp. PMI_390]|nr:hypothetical protein DL93DRAFT_2096386 [Clavulina sp. PMI_390]